MNKMALGTIIYSTPTEGGGEGNVEMARKII